MKGTQIPNRIADVVEMRTSVAVDFSKVSAQIRKKLHNIVRLRIATEGYHSKATALSELFGKRLTIYRNMMTLVWEHMNREEKEIMAAKACLLDVKLPDPGGVGHWVYMQPIRNGGQMDWKLHEKNKRIVKDMFRLRAETLPLDPIDPEQAEFRQQLMYAIETKGKLGFIILEA